MGGVNYPSPPPPPPPPYIHCFVLRVRASGRRGWRPGRGPGEGSPSASLSPWLLSQANLDAPAHGRIPFVPYDNSAHRHCFAPVASALPPPLARLPVSPRRASVVDLIAPVRAIACAPLSPVPPIAAGSRLVKATQQQTTCFRGREERGGGRSPWRRLVLGARVWGAGGDRPTCRGKGGRGRDPERGRGGGR